MKRQYTRILIASDQQYCKSKFFYFLNLGTHTCTLYLPIKKNKTTFPSYKVAGFWGFFLRKVIFKRNSQRASQNG